MRYQNNYDHFEEEGEGDSVQEVELFLEPMNEEDKYMEMVNQQLSSRGLDQQTLAI